ncbi:MAG: putative protein N(5)-glutamine methyltransferase [Micromonosporaceae bacterium]
MSSPQSTSPYPALVTRLRAAGCVFAEDEARLLMDAARSAAELTALVDQRLAGVPLEHVLGWVQFHGLRIAVAPGVFVPRHRTEFLVDQAVERALGRAVSHGSAHTVVVDLCCGCGAVGAALAAAIGTIDLYAVDIDPVAVRCARGNLPGGTVYEGDLYQPLPKALRGRVDILVANAPYVPTDAVGLMPREARGHEPLAALDGGPDGLDVARRVVTSAADWLAPGGHVLIETSERQAPRLVETVAFRGLVPRLAISDNEDAWVVIGTKPQI